MLLVDNFRSDLLKVLACPVLHTQLSFEGGDFVSENLRWSRGDFRFQNCYVSSKKWSSGQRSYERFANKWANMRQCTDYQLIDAETKEVYENFHLNGKVLDVGGGFGTVAIQARVAPENYISVDPMVCQWATLDPASAFARHYAAGAMLVRIPGMAERLPLFAGQFDTVHMRSCLDHFADPLAALLEARRVLKSSGQLIIGISLDGAFKLTGSKLRDFVKKTVKASFVGDIYEHLFDDHVFHPTAIAVTQLLTLSGFQVVETMQQPGYYNVVYIKAVPCRSLQPNFTLVQ